MKAWEVGMCKEARPPRVSLTRLKKQFCITLICGCWEQRSWLVSHIGLFSAASRTSCHCCGICLSGRQCLWGDPTSFRSRALVICSWPSSELWLSSQAQILLWKALQLILPKAHHRPALCFWLCCFILSALLASSKEEFR